MLPTYNFPTLPAIFQAFQTLENIEVTASRNDKEAFLKQYKDNSYLQKMIFWAYSDRKYHNYVEGKFNEEELESYENMEVSKLEERFERFGNILEDLTNRNITGNAATSVINEFFSDCYRREYKWLSRVLNRDLRCGFTAVTATKVFGKNFWGEPSDDPLAWPGIMKADRWSGWNDTYDVLWIDGKLNGYRLSAVVGDGRVIFYSSSGKSEPYTTNLQHIAKQILDAGFDNCCLEGEIKADTWSSTGIVKRKKLRPGDDQKLLDEVRYYVFDYIDYIKLASDGKCVITQNERRGDLDRFFVSCKSEKLIITLKDPTKSQTISCRGYANLKLVDYMVVTNESELNGEHQRNRKAGFEGSMVKDPNGLYTFGKRTSAWLKIKPVHDIDVKIVDIIIGTGKNSHRMGALFVEDKNGEQFNCGQGFTDLHRDLFWKYRDKMIGMTVELEAQDETNAEEGRKAINAVFLRLRVDRDDIDVDEEILNVVADGLL